MTRPRRQLKIGMAFLILASLVVSLAAPAGAWFCDTGQPCRGRSKAGCCCPGERPGYADEASSCCRSFDADAAPPAACSPHHAGADRRSVGGAPGCCEPATAQSLRSSAAAIALSAAPYCRCRYSVSDRPETLVPFDAIRIASVPPPVSVLRALAPPPPPPAARLRPRDEAPPERHLDRSPLGSRAPPACRSLG